MFVIWLGGGSCGAAELGIVGIRAAGTLVVVVESCIFWEVLVTMLVAAGAFGDFGTSSLVIVDARRRVAAHPVRICL